MYIGKLNQKPNSITCEIYRKNTRKVPNMQKTGNPIYGEPVAIRWTELLETGLDIHITIDGKYLINEVVLCLGEKSKPIGIKVYTANKKEELYRYLPETGKTIREKKIVLPIETYLCEFVIEINAEFSDVIIESVDIYGADFSGEQILPTPLEYSAKSANCVPVSFFQTYSFDCEIGELAGKILKEKMEEAVDISLTCTDNGRVKLICNNAISANGYRLSVNKTGAVIKASDLRGMVYGAETFIKLASGGDIVECEIKDVPRMQFRGVHLMLPHPDQFDFVKRLVKYVISPMGYNTIIMEIAGGMEFESHPEINRAVEEAFVKGENGEWPLFPHREAGMGKTVKKEVMAEFVRYCRSFGIDVIPEIQSLGHVQFMTLAYPEIAEYSEKTAEETEVDERQADIPPSEFYRHSYCPSNPKSYEILFDLIDEIIEVFEPQEYVHMGHDEVYQIGVCPKCKGKDPAELFAKDIDRIYQYLKKKNLKMMIWADMLQPVTKYRTPPAIDKIPKDIVLLDFIWYFHMDKDIEDNLLEKGFSVILGNMYSSHYPRYESRIVKDGILGAQVTSWVETKEDVMAREGKIYEILYTGQMLWSAEYSRHARYSYDKVLNKMMPQLRQKLGNQSYPSLMEGREEIVLVDNGEYRPEISEYGGAFKLECKAESLIIEHTATEKLTRFPWVELDEIGQYLVTYSDGSSVSIPVTYAGNVSYWNRRHNEPFKVAYYRHNGYSATYFTDGIEKQIPGWGVMTVYRYEWINPKPEVVIETIKYIPNAEFETNVYVSRILGCQITDS